MSTIEQEIIKRIQTLNTDQQKQVLAFLDKIGTEPTRLSARELMELPAEERQRRVQESIAAAANEDFELFEAYSEEPIHD